MALVTNWCAPPWKGYVREATSMKSDRPDMSWSRTSTDMQTQMGNTHETSALDKELWATKECQEREKSSFSCFLNMLGVFSFHFHVTLCICSTLYILSHTLILNDKHISLFPLMHSFRFTLTIKSICVLCLSCAFGKEHMVGSFLNPVSQCSVI